MNINYYTEKYRLYNFSSSKLLDFYKEFEHDFLDEFVGKNRIVRLSQLQFSHIQNAVNKSIETLIQLELISRGALPINIIWKTLFMRKVQLYTLKFFPTAIDDSFFKLQYVFDSNHKNETISNKSEPTSQINGYISFMGLKPNFTKTELIRRYRQLCLLYHPDKGGSSQMFIQLQKAKNELEIYLTIK